MQLEFEFPITGNRNPSNQANVATMQYKDKEPYWQSTSAEEAAAVLVSSHGEGAGEEALMRAFLAERDCNRGAVLFWIAVHSLLLNSEDVLRVSGK
jgi:two-component SAPR family response regulator